jgi:hypothetical protein
VRYRRRYRLGLAKPATAESETLDALGDLLREHTLHFPEQQLAIEARNEAGTVFRVSAVVRLQKA